MILAVPWKCVDLVTEVNKVKSIILSKISCNSYCDSDTKKLDYFITHTNDKPTSRCGKLYTIKLTF